jgi:hypothetical protein
MGYGGIFKTVARIAVTYVGFQLGGSFGAAVASAAFTGATGGSFKEALMSGATAYLGAEVSQGVGQGITDLAAGGVSTAVEGASLGTQSLINSALQNAAGAGVINPLNVGAGTVFQNAISGLGSTADALGQGVLHSGLIADVGAANAAAEAFQPDFLTGLAQEAVQPLDLSLTNTPVSGVTKFLGENVVDPLANATSSSFAVYNAAKDQPLLNLLPDFVSQAGDLTLNTGSEILSAAAASTSPASLFSGAVGGLATLTLEQALNMEIPGLDQALIDEAGFSPEGVQALRIEARNALSQAKFDELTAADSGLVNPFFRNDQFVPEVDQAEADLQNQASIDEFLKVIASGIERENVALGPNVTQQQFEARFADPSFGQNVLQSEEDLRKQAFGQEVSGAFPGGAFDPIDDTIIDAILDERIEPVQRQIATAGARGNLNRYGGRTANEELIRQRGAGFENVSQIGEGLQQGSQSEIDFIRDRAAADVEGFQLGDEPFDVAPFSQERSDLIGAKEGSLGADLSSAVGNQPIFDVQKALNIGGRAQGPVSGPVNQSFLDAIARGGGVPAAAKTRRGLGQSGRGVF